MDNVPGKGTILSCFFPLNESPETPGPIARPALILGSFRSPKDKSTPMVIVAYGTSRKARANLGLEIRVASIAKKVETGLHRPTRFTLNRLRILPYNSQYFDFSVGGSPVIGMLSHEDNRALTSYLDQLSDHSDQLNFFRPKEALANGKTFDMEEVDSYMKENMTGVQLIKAKGPRRRNIYRRA